ncbi:MAG: zf-TFIIB domain-containing protein [Anaerolineae bacterium]|nr:zf-TFIIB domain-containing protein [Anaerolineae bacterium]
MRCPRPDCGAELRLAERQGVEIEYCPVCRGVWLDRGELDKIIERSNAWTAANEADLEMMRRDAGRAEPEKAKRDAFRDDRREGRFDLDIDADLGDRYERRGRDYRDDDDDDDYRSRGDARSRKKKGFLGDLFDIFD